MSVLHYCCSTYFHLHHLLFRMWNELENVILFYFIVCSTGNNQSQTTVSFRNCTLSLSLLLWVSMGPRIFSTFLFYSLYFPAWTAQTMWTSTKFRCLHRLPNPHKMQRRAGNLKRNSIAGQQTRSMKSTNWPAWGN
jgi:hypothetical protein